MTKSVVSCLSTFRRARVILVAAIALGTAVAAGAEEEIAENASATGCCQRIADAPSEIPALPWGVDGSFQRHIDMDQLLRALQQCDPAGLADAALILKDGERILQRECHHFPARTLLDLAMRAAVIKHDEATLRRLAQSGDAELASRIDAQRKLVAPSRTAAAEVRLSVEQTTPQQFAACRQLLDAIDAATLLSDSTQLTQLRDRLGGCSGLTKGQQKQLRDHLDRVAVGNVGPATPAFPEALQKLLAASRSGNSLVPNYPNDAGLPMNYWVVIFFAPQAGYWMVDSAVAVFNDGSSTDAANKARAKARRQQLVGCGYQAKIEAHYYPPAQFGRANCPRATSPAPPVGTIGSTSAVSDRTWFNLENHTSVSVTIYVYGSGQSITLGARQKGTYWASRNGQTPWLIIGSRKITLSPDSTYVITRTSAGSLLVSSN